MKRRQTTALLLGMALTVISLSGCAGEKSAEQTGKTGTDIMQEQVWQDKPETADGGIPSYEDYLKINGDAEELPEDMQIEIWGGGIFPRRSFERLRHRIYGQRKLFVLGYTGRKCFLGI